MNINIKHTLRTALTIPLTALVFASGAFMLFTPVDTHAQSISLEPASIDRSNPQERGWFLYNVKPGDTITDTVVVRNATAFDTKIQLNANDATVTTDGTFSLSPNDVPNTQLGSWISLSQTTLPVAANESLAIPFTLSVPQDAKSGEYAGGLSAIIVDEDQTTGVGAKLRLGVRMYLTVDGELNLNPSISSMSIANPQQSDFEARLRSRGSINMENMGFFITAQERGNIYSKSVNKVTFTLPDGKQTTKNFTRNYVPGQPETEFYVQSDLPYQVGETTVTLEYEAAPFIDNKPNLNKQNQSGTLTYSMKLTDEDIAKFKEVYEAVKKTKETRREAAITTPLNAEKSSFTIQEGNIAEVSSTSKTETNQYVIYGLVGVITLLVVALAVILLKNKKSKPETIKTTEKSDEKTKNSKESK